MAIQLHTFAKLSGKTGDAAYRKVQEWSRIELQADRKDQPFPRRVLPDVARFVKGLRQSLSEPSTLHFVEFLDTWSVAISQLDILLGVPSFIFIKNAGLFSIGACQLPGDRSLQALLKQQLRRRHVQQYDQQTRIFVLNLLETLKAYEKLCPAATVIIVREVFTDSFADDDLIPASKSIAPWIRS